MLSHDINLNVHMPEKLKFNYNMHRTKMRKHVQMLMQKHCKIIAYSTVSCKVIMLKDENMARIKEM